MNQYAQTNIQLFNQLQKLGYASSELKRVANAFKFAMQIFTGMFRASGKTFIAHLVGTASILAHLQAPCKLIITGLLHAAYSHGDFGTGQIGITKAKKNQLVQVVGEEIEDYIARFTTLDWNTQVMAITCEQVATLNMIERDILLVRLANELEERLDLGILYCGDFKHQIYAERDYLLPEIAIKIGYPALAEAFNKAFKELASAELDREICNLTHQQASTLVIPNSCHRKTQVLFQQMILQRANYYWRRSVNRFLTS